MAEGKDTGSIAARLSKALAFVGAARKSRVVQAIPESIQGSGPMDMPAPVAIGGVGGSGTRMVAQILHEAGLHMGDDINGSSDTLWFTLLFKHLEILKCDDAEFSLLTKALVAALVGGSPLAPDAQARVRELARANRPQHPAAWLQERCDSLLASARRQPARSGPWGWKEPNTHVVIERLWQQIPELQYVHVVRNGVHMANSSNQSQLRLWGPHILGSSEPVTPRRSLAFWCAVHRRMQRLVEANPQRMYLLDYDALCRAPRKEAAKLCRFLGYDAAQANPALGQIRSPSKRDRIDLRDFDEADLQYVHSLGYGVLGPHLA